MAETDDGLFNIEVDADDYAEAAAGDTPSVPRTYQSEEDFQKQKSSYTAKIDDGDNYGRLLEVLPVLRSTTAGTDERCKLSKKDFQLLGYAVGELYYDRRYEEARQLCERALERFVVDDRVRSQLQRWVERCTSKLTTPANG